MKASVLVITFIIGAVGSVSAQTAQRSASDESQVLRARQQISMMEGVLERAVQNGVDNLRRKVRAVMPDDALMQGGLPQVRGFRLEGYGIFFDVEVPGLRQSMAWTLRTLNDTGIGLARDLARLRSYVQSVEDARVRADLDRTLQRIQRGIGPVPAGAPERASTQVAAAPTVAAQSIEVASVPPPAVAVAAQADPAVSLDPSDAYTEEVKTALVDAMLEYSGALVIGPDEWLTVAARDNQPNSPFAPGDPDPKTMLLRIKGTDLSAFRAGRLTLDEARARVDVREF